MRGTPTWDVVYLRDYGRVIDANGQLVPLTRRAHFASGLCEVIVCDADGNRMLNADKTGPELEYKFYPAPLTFEAINPWR